MRIIHYNDEERDLHRYLEKRGHQNTIVAADANPFEIVARESFDAAFIGLHPHGLRLLKALRQRNPQCIVTIITSDRKTRMAVEAMKSGAFDYLISPLDFTEVERTCILLDREAQMIEERRRLQAQLQSATDSSRFVGTTQAIINLRRLIAKAAASHASVLLVGETGTGKELVARLLHEQSPRNQHPFISINCNAIPSMLLESELFGYRKGAFTGADSNRDGLLVEAERGTFFFDEIHDLEPLLQGKLLRVLQENEVRPLGTKSTIRLNVRFIAATNQDLGQLVSQQRFREDLFYRLNVIPIRIPPLRERMEDLPLLARHFLDLHANRESREPLKVSPDAWRLLNQYHWPGNVRELENLCHRAVALADGDTLDVDLLSLTAVMDGSSGPTLQRSSASLNASYRDMRTSVERELLEQALLKHQGNISRAAAALGISRTTLYEKIRRYQIAPPASAGRVPALKSVAGKLS
jgi:two-component system response regulator AtoC